jgi:hypothetical protein
MLTLLQGNAVSYDEGGDHSHSRRDSRRREEDDSRERRGDDRWREREEERRMGGGSRERDWGRTEAKAGPSFATYTPIWSAVPSRCDSS